MLLKTVILKQQLPLWVICDEYLISRELVNGHNIQSSLPIPAISGLNEKRRYSETGGEGVISY